MFVLHSVFISTLLTLHVFSLLSYFLIWLSIVHPITIHKHITSTDCILFMSIFIIIQNSLTSNKVGSARRP
jgi:hypothetical protein